MKNKLLDYISGVELEGRFLLGIDGLSRSGKTTLVKDIETVLIEQGIPYYIFHIDDHIVERDQRYDTGNAEWFEYYHLQWDVEKLLRDFFMKIKESNELNLSFYNDKSDRLTRKQVDLPEKSLVIVEGVFLQRLEWRKFFDFIVYLDCPRNKRFQRENGFTQQKTNKFKNRYWKAEEYYLKTIDPIRHADLVMKS